MGYGGFRSSVMLTSANAAFQCAAKAEFGGLVLWKVEPSRPAR